MRLELENEPEVERDAADPEPTEREQLAHENQTDPRLPRCLIEATDKKGHLRVCARCRSCM